MGATSTNKIIRFGLFELDARVGELRKNGSRVRLTQQPVQVLCILLERPGEVVTREELRRRLWAADVFVDFDHGLNKSIQKLREALGDSADSPRYIETIPRTGYRFLAPVTEGEKPLEGETVAGKRRESTVLRFAVTCVVATLAAVLLIRMRGEVHATSPIRSLAVMPLENLSGDARQEYFADGMTDELITELARIPTLRVISQSSVMRNKDSRKTVEEIASELHVDAIVEGSVSRAKDRVRITAQLIDGRDGKYLWARSFEGQSSDTLTMQDDVARAIAMRTEAVLTPKVRSKLADNRSINPEGYDAYLRGRYFLQKREPDKSVSYLQQAIRLEPNYSPAHAWLAIALESEALVGLMGPKEALTQGEDAAKRAIALNPEDGEAYTALGGLEASFKWNWPEAEKNLQRGIELSPNSSDAELEYAAYLDTVGRPEEAVQHMRRALELDPLSFFMNRHLGSTLYFARHYDEALYHLKQAREMEPDKSGFVDGWTSWVFQKEGKLDDAVNSDLDLVRAKEPAATVERLRAIYKHAGWKAYWETRIADDKPIENHYCMSYFQGLAYLRTGNRDEAFVQFDRAADERCFWIAWMKVDPLLDKIRGDRRYKDLLHRVNLTE